MIETAGDATFFVDQPFFEKTDKRLRLVSLNFSVLDGRATSDFVIDGDGPKSSCAGFDLFRFLAKPEMNVPLESARFELFRRKNHVRIAIVKSPIELEFLNGKFKKG